MLVAIDCWDAAVTNSWQGVRGATHLRLLAAFLLTCMRVGKVRLSLSYRQWAEEAGVSKSQVEKHALLLAPWIVRTRRGSRATGRATEWQIGRPPKREIVDSRSKPDGVASGLSTVPRLPPSGSIVSPSSDIFDRKPAAWLLANLLDSDAPDFTVLQMVTATGLHPSTVRTNLHYLAACGLVERIDRTTWRAVADPEHVGMTPIGEVRRRRAERHAAERWAYKRRFVDPETGEVLSQAWHPSKMVLGERLA